MLSPSRSLICGLCLVTALSASAHGAESVSNTLSVHRIVVRADGSEQAQAATAARPGELLEYDAEFRNSGTAVARGLQATLPIPQGVTYVAGSAHPAGAQASVDGTKFSPMPLVRRVRHPDGTLAEERVPLSEYRYLRWAPADLTSNGALSVSARVVVAGATAESTTRP